MLEDKETVIREKRFKQFGIVSICQTAADIVEPNSPEGISGESCKSISAPKKAPKSGKKQSRAGQRKGMDAPRNRGPQIESLTGWYVWLNFKRKHLVVLGVRPSKAWPRCQASAAVNQRHIRMAAIPNAK